MGFSTLNTLLVQMLNYVFQLIFVLFATGLSSYFRNVRTYCIAFNFAVSIMGSALVRYLDTDLKWARFFGFCFAIAYSANFPMIIAMVSCNVAGFTKKTSVNAMVWTLKNAFPRFYHCFPPFLTPPLQVFIAYCAGNIIGPQIFFSWQAPTYNSGFQGMMVCFVVAFITTLLLRFHLAWQNRRRDRESTPDSQTEDWEVEDKTDIELRQFRYVL